VITLDADLQDDPSVIEAMVDAGQIETGHTLICLYWLMRHRQRVRQMWLGA
jgi:hypothetical protein